ncbi:MAG: hypothetical protein K0U68_04030 [Gammaproteobacteria bacterium]|nr:hypothetical protein [Gammaproteobacteria bacterium]
MPHKHYFFLMFPFLFLLYINPAYSVVVVPADNVIINETFDPVFGFGSYSVTNNMTGSFPDNVIFAFAVENPFAILGTGEGFDDGMIGWASQVFTMGSNEGPFSGTDLSSFSNGSRFIGFFTKQFNDPFGGFFPESLSVAIGPNQTIDGFNFQATQANSSFIAFTGNKSIAGTGETIIQFVPIPAAFWLFSSALAGLIAIKKR